MKVVPLVLVLLIHLVQGGGNQHRRVLLSDVQTLTLHKGEKTNARRVSAVPQVKCVGGAARGAFEPDVVQCYNRGSNGYDIQWECNAEMPQQYKFGKLSVSCEGYEYPDDPNILAGSCGLEYNLEYTNKGYQGSHSSNVRHASGSTIWSFLMKVAIIVGIFFFLKSFISGQRSTGGVAGMSAGPDRRPPGGGGGGGWFSNFFPGGFGGFGGGAPGNPGRQPPPPGFRTDYTNDADCHTARPHTQQGGTGNFFTGAALGALGGYLFGARNQRNANYYARDTANTGWFGGGGTTTHRQTPSPSFGGGGGGGTHTSSGFGGTTRR